MSQLTITFCTVIKNRLHHLLLTLPVSIFQNSQQYVKFLVLDYNSQDGLENYIKDMFSEEIESGKLTYYRNPEPEHFSQSHSRNMAFKLAETDLVCNVDADNFVGPGFGKFLCEEFQKDENIYYTGIGNALDVEDVRGKVCVRRSNFLHIRGYDESFEGYGYEDYDFINRLDMLGFKRKCIDNPSYLLALTHPNSQRVSNEKVARTLHSLYVHFFNPDKSEFLYLMKDGTSFRGTILNNYTSRNTDYPYISSEAFELDFKYLMDDGGWKQGTWNEREDGISIKTGCTTEFFEQHAEENQQKLQGSNRIFYKATSKAMLGEGAMFFMLVRNREKMLHNENARNIIIDQFFGKGLVYKNHNNESAILIN